MRWLWLISILQFIAILVLIGRIISLEHALVVTTPSSSSSAEHAASDGSRSISPDSDIRYPSAAIGRELDQATLREIIREELQAAMAARPAASSPARQAPDPVYSKEFEVQLHHVSAKLESVISAGAISNADMESLHLEIGQLHPKDRRMVLSRLAKSINAGTVKLTR